MRIPQWLSVSVLFGIIITVLFILPYCEKAMAKHIFWDYTRNDYVTVPENLRINNYAEFYALQELYPKPVRKCPWTHMAVPESEVDAYYKLGWEPFNSYKDKALVAVKGCMVLEPISEEDMKEIKRLEADGARVSFIRREVYDPEAECVEWREIKFYEIKKRICQEGK